jgi:hypothetical protein
MLIKLKMVAALLLTLGEVTLLTRGTASTQQNAGAGQRAPKKEDARAAAKESRNTPHDFTNIQRLAAALADFNYPENAANNITVWFQSGGKGTSVTFANDNARTLDLTRALLSAFSGKWEGFDLENVAIVRAGDRSIQFMDVKDNMSSNKPSTCLIKRGDLVVVLKAVEK